MASIRAHKDSNTLIIMKNSSYARPITHRINLILGMNARCMEQVAIDGDLELGKNAQVTGSVRARNVILGPGSTVYGDVTVYGDLKALDNASVIGHVAVQGGAFIRPGVRFGSLDVGGLIEIQGRPPSKHIQGKMVVNDDMDYPELKKMGAEAIKKAEPEKGHVIQPPKVPVKAEPEKTKPAKGKQAQAQKKGKKKAPEEEKPKKKGFFGLFK
jgi:carbonic anhydrase/acetyltransferase-like protein (isoleucine patch superfamily)